jgi:hypothetical protein
MLKLFKTSTIAVLLAITSSVQADAVSGSFTNRDEAKVNNTRSSIKDGDTHIAIVKDGLAIAEIAVNCSPPKDRASLKSAPDDMTAECHDLIVIDKSVDTAMTNKPEMSLEAWQLRLITDPDDHMLKREANGLVFIYDRLLDSKVDEILDNHFDRIDSMMFTRVKVTDANGDIQLDPETGEELQEDDGCD